MPNPQFTKPWHGIPREDILWNLTVNEDLCIGCATCVTGCSRLVYRYDFERKKAVVVDPLNCMIGCTTCANTCPTHALSFPPIETIFALEQLPSVHHAIEDDLRSRYETLHSELSIPHNDRIITLKVSHIERHDADHLRLILSPAKEGECFCEFMPGQYIELWQSGSDIISRAYSVANLAGTEGAIELHMSRVEGGRFTSWVFDSLKEGELLNARGPLGNFTLGSHPQTPLLFVAGGTGLAPILALLRQTIVQEPQRDLVLLWSTKEAADLYALDELGELCAKASRLQIYVSTHTQTLENPLAPCIFYRIGNAVTLLKSTPSLLQERDIYAAGPSAMMRALGKYLQESKITTERIHIDSFGI